MKKEFWINLIIAILVFLLIIIIFILILNQMGEKIDYECSKIDCQRIISLWDVDIDCGLYYPDTGRDYAYSKEMGK